ncbi:hypothetical protein BHE74_00006420, partial [Ensete ventricosum]
SYEGHVIATVPNRSIACCPGHCTLVGHCANPDTSHVASCQGVLFVGQPQRLFPTKLFFACFHLYKSRRGYYLTARAGFKVNGAPTNNKGWKARYFFVSSPSWGFRADWSIHPISNVLPLLYEEESVAVNRLRGILPLSLAIRDMTESWLVEAGLSPASREAPDAGGEGAPAADPESAQPEVEVTHTEASGKRLAGSSTPDPTATGRPRKRVKIIVRRHKAHHGEGSSHKADRERESEVLAGDTSPTYNQPKSMRDLCDMRVREDDKGHYILQMADWAPSDSSAAMRARWLNLSYQSRVWDDSKATSEFDKGVLYPTLAKDLYTLHQRSLLPERQSRLCW